jgi:WXXGXW repeat (2 copies)
MKKLSTILFVCGLSLLGTKSHAQLVSVRVNLPSPPQHRVRDSRPPCPSPDYIWREGRWVWDNYVRDYVWSAGYWEYAQPRRCEAPPAYSRNGKGHKHGHWKNRDRD